MKKPLEQLLYYSVSNCNILPLTSACNMRCIFCSHQFNPPELEVYSLPSCSLKQVEEMIDFLDEDQKIIIGESATRIIEGEPFLHPNFFSVLKLVREKFPRTPIQITTNGSLLGEKEGLELKKYLPLEINLSLNSASLWGREKLMHDSRAEVSLNCAKILEKQQIPFHGSIVAVPQLVGWEDVEATILYLDMWGAKTIRFFLPGYSNFKFPSWAESFPARQEIGVFLERMREKIDTPILLEPPYLDNLEGTVEGIIINSPSRRAGLKRGDKVCGVNGQTPWSRVDAYELIKKADNPSILIEKMGKYDTVVLEKEAEDSGGLVFSYDLSRDVLKQWQGIIQKHQAKKILFLTSVLAENIVRSALSWLADLSLECQVVKVENKYLGGSLISAGLLMVEDYIQALTNHLLVFKPDVIILSGRSFDPWGRDLLGRSYLELSDQFSLPIELVQN